MWTFNQTRYFGIFLTIGLFLLSQTLLFARLNHGDRVGDKAFIQDLKVSIASVEISSGSIQDFGNVNLLSSSSALTIVLENIGSTDDLNLGALNLIGANTADFVLNTSGLVSTLGPSMSTSFTISFVPTLSGDRTATLEIPSDDPDGTFIINLAGAGLKLDQSITFNALSSKTYGEASFTLGATASSSLPVTYVSSNPGVATISGNTVTIVGAGSTNITAAQVGDATYNAAADVIQELIVNKANPIITWSDPSPITYGTALSVTQLNAIASVVGVLTYTPVVGTVLNAGNQTLRVDFVPTDATNYNSVLNTTVSLTVNKATPVITWPTPASITYGTALSATQLNANTGVPGTYNYAPASGTILNAGINQLDVEFIPTDNSNYNQITGSVNLTVLKKDLSATADNMTRVYNSTDPVFTISYIGFVNGDGVGQLDVLPTASTTAVALSPVGSYPITPAGGADNNYSFTYVAGSLTIEKATPIVTWSNPSAITYGTALGATQLNATTNVPGSFSYLPAAGTILNAGNNQSLLANFTPADIVNYNIVTGASVLISVTKAVLNVTADNKDKVYGSANPALTVSYSGFVNSETIAVLDALSSASTIATVVSPVGSYTITPAGGSDNNYAFNYINGSLTINKAILTATANNQSRSYGASDPAFTIIYSGFVNSETVAALDAVPTASSAATANSPVGSYPITVGGGSDNNYDFTYLSGTLTINKAIITATANNQTKVYGSVNPALTISYTGFANSETEAVINTPPTTSTLATETSAVGSYPITVAGGADDNYDFTYVGGSLSVTKATLTVTANNQSRTYGAANPVLTISYSGFVNGDNSAVIDSSPTATSAANATTPVGTYPIVAAGGSDNNYSLVFVSGVITITKATVTATALDVSRSYGAANPTLTISYSGFVNSETFAVLDVVPTISTTAIQASNVGTYPISVSGGSDANYDILYTAGTFTITKATVTASASNASRVYGEPNPVFAISYTGFVNGESVLVLDATANASTTATSASPVGTYPITVSGGLDNNYSFTYVNATLTITKATPTVTWNNPSAITYGTLLSATQLNATASVPGSFSYTPAQGTLLNVGANQVLSVNFTPTDITNYNVVTGTTVILAVTKATVTVTANNQSRVYGATNPALTVSYSGFVNGETVAVIDTAPLASTTASSLSPVGSYPITVSGGLDGNYDFVYVSGALNVTKANVTAIAADASRVYGSANPAFSINYTGFVNGEDFSVLTTLPTASTTAILTSSVGAYPIALTGGTDDNYTILYTAGTLTITKATITASASNANRVYGVANPVFSIAYSGFVNGESASVIDSSPTATTSATLTSSVGTYPITVSGGSDNNYSFTYVNATLTITKANPIITWSNPLPITYGTALTATQLNASANVGGTFTYTPAFGTVLAAGANQVLSVNFAPSDATNYNAVLGTTVQITVNKANPVITWSNPLPITYGTALSATQLNASANVTGSFIYTPAIGTILNAGVGQSLSVNFSPTDASNYNPVNGTTVLITVNKATPIITWANPAAITYGTALSSTQLNATASVSGGFVYAPGLGTILNAGINQSLSVNFTPTDAANYNSVNGTTVLITVNKATPTVSWSNPTAITYGTPLGAAQLNATATVPGTFNYAPASGTILNAGVNQLLTVNFTPGDAINYNPVNGTTVVITVNKATPVITWANPAAITYGTALSATQLNATANVPGIFTYAPTAGTLLNAGVNQVLTMDFAPTDAANYNPVNDVQRLITVNKANPVITWANPTPIIYGTPLSATQLNATANVPGTFSYTPPNGTVLNVGVNQILSTNFIPTDASNYNSILGRTVQITVTKATPFVTWATPLPIKVNEALTASQLNATASVPGTFTYAPALGTSFGTPGSYTLSVAFTPTDAINYNSVPNTQVQISVNNKDNPVITWANPASITYGTPLSATQLNASASVTGTFIYTPASGSILNAGTNQILSVSFIPNDATNYNTVNSSVQITINKATLTATAVSTSRIYGASNPVFSINYSGFVNGENIGVIDTQPIASCSAIAGDNAGSVFPIIPSGGVDNNYSFNYVNGSLTITKAALIARADNKSRSYGLANPAFTISFTGFVNGDTESEITIPSASTPATSLSNVGSYPITLSGGASINYNLTLQNGSLTINTSPLIARASDVTRTYGQANPALTIVYSGFLNGDNASSITQPSISTAANATSSVGTYPITLSGGSALNYGIILQPGTMTINKASLTVTANNQTRTYGATNPILTYTYTGFMNGETSTVIDSAPAVTTSASVASNAGTYPITVSGGSDNNYNLLYTAGTLTINKALLTATVANSSRLYGSANPTFIINYSGFVNAENSSVIDVIPSTTTTATFTSTVGAYPITASGGTDNNYNFNYVAGSLSITKATIIAASVNASRPYGTNNPTFIINYSGFVNGETASVLDTPPSATTTALVASPIGTYPITVSGGLDNNYTITTVNAVLTIFKATPIITWSNPAAITYGTTLSTTQLNATASIPGTFTYTPSVGTLLNAGENQVLTVNFSPTDATNYNAVAGTTVLITVNKATPTVTWSTPATITYGTALSATQLNAVASIPGTFLYSPASGTILNAGTNQTLSVTFTPTNTTNFNSVIGTTVQITVNKATPIITWTNPAAITYGTALSDSQLNASSSVPGIFTYTPSVGTILNAGSNQILSANFTPTNLANYLPVNGTTVQITVNKANPVITWPTPAAITYGTALGSAQLNASANTAGTFVYTPASGTILNVGANQVLSVNFTPTNLTNFNTVLGSTVLITVNKATPIITWLNPASISYGTALSSAQLNATTNVPGTFTYTPAIGTLLNAGANQSLSVNFTPTNSSNYNLVSGTTVQITVNKITLVATANNQSRAYGSANPSLTINYSGFVNGEIETSLDTAPVTSTIANLLSPVGVYDITVSGGIDNNYNFTYVPGSITITKASLTATANDQIRLFGTPNPPLTIGYTGFLNNDTSVDLDILPTTTTTATNSSPVGGYPITVSGGSDNNYSFTYVPGTLTITPNFPPDITGFSIETTEDVQYNFSYANFGDNFSSFSGNPIVYVKIISLPVNGVLFWNGAAVSIGAEITVNNGAIDNLFYLPNTNFNGFDSFRWNAFEGTFLALQDATVSIKIVKVNDAPSLSNIETSSILYSLGDPSVTITKTVVINDVDDNFVFSAKVSIAENFTDGDLLALEQGVSVEIESSYNASTGELELTGRDTRSNYEIALTKVLFSSPVSGAATISDKRIDLVVKDSLNNSNIVSRIVTITEVFPELDIVNSFTPNGDGVNDNWDFINLDFYTEVDISVFDRNGRVVYKCQNNECKWDGKFNGSELPVGTYLYTIYLNGGKRKYQGDVTILR